MARLVTICHFMICNIFCSGAIYNIIIIIYCSYTQLPVQLTHHPPPLSWLWQASGRQGIENNSAFLLNLENAKGILCLGTASSSLGDMGAHWCKYKPPAGWVVKYVRGWERVPFVDKVPRIFFGPGSTYIASTNLSLFQDLSFHATNTKYMLYSEAFL